MRWRCSLQGLQQPMAVVNMQQSNQAGDSALVAYATSKVKDGYTAYTGHAAKRGPEVCGSSTFRSTVSQNVSL